MTKILILCKHYAVASGRYMADAFKRIGCEVRTMGQPMGSTIWGIQIDPKYVWQPDYDGNGTKPRGFWKPDLVLQMDTEFRGADDIYPEAPHAIYTVDNHVRVVRDLGHWDHQFLAHHDGPAQPVCDCTWNSWLPCAYDPVWFTPSPIPMAERTLDVAIVGFPYDRRKSIVQAMISAGLKVWADLGPMYGKYRDIYHSARISLCVSAAGDVAQRVFETAAMGCAILTDRCTDFGRLGFEHGHQGWIYDTDDRAVADALALIHTPKELKRIASEGQEWARSHTWDARAKTILEKMGLK